MNLYYLHGLLQTIAFFVLFPLGALIAYFREHVGSNWKVFHVSIQLLATLLVFSAVIIVISIKKGNKQDKPIINKVHTKLGPLIVLVIIIQLVWAFLGRKLVDWTTWYNTHMILSGLIITGGITNVILGMKMMS
jgi:hypothetical protein